MKFRNQLNQMQHTGRQLIERAQAMLNMEDIESIGDAEIEIVFEGQAQSDQMNYQQTNQPVSRVNEAKKANSSVNWKQFGAFESIQKEHVEEDIITLPQLRQNTESVENNERIQNEVIIISSDEEEEKDNEQEQKDIEEEEIQFVAEVGRLLRNFLPTKHYSTSEINTYQPGFTLKICTYNVLCESVKSMHPNLYRESEQHIKWEKRKKLILKEITCLNADVYCLQEVEVTHYEQVFKSFFDENGFKCFYTCRKFDGCLIAYRSNKFEKIKLVDVPYNYGIEGFNEDNVGQIALLKENGSNLIFLVANTHILSNMERGDLKTGQIALFLATIDKYVQKFSQNEDFAGTILCGDFNIEPFSPLYYFIVDGALNFSEFSHKVLAYDPSGERKEQSQFRPFVVPVGVPLNPGTCQLFAKDQEGAECSVNTLLNNHRFLSAYRHSTTKDFEPEISKRHEYAGCRDFVFYSAKQKEPSSPSTESRIFIRGTLTLPSLKDLDNTCGKMPNSQCGSDHLSLMCEFFVC
ncbi:Endo/exonuclease/phosphatase domain-containing protein [Aphelenchoides bicaudatus]|nr:Endo/exonuclease/phosphatase domain-containing protein [Aphelenchoides bicaudatus]